MTSLQDFLQNISRMEQDFIFHLFHLSTGNCIKCIPCSYLVPTLYSNVLERYLTKNRKDRLKVTFSRDYSDRILVYECQFCVK